MASCIALLRIAGINMTIQLTGTFIILIPFLKLISSLSSSQWTITIQFNGTLQHSIISVYHQTICLFDLKTEGFRYFKRIAQYFSTVICFTCDPHLQDKKLLSKCSSVCLLSYANLIWLLAVKHVTVFRPLTQGLFGLKLIQTKPSLLTTQPFDLTNKGWLVPCYLLTAYSTILSHSLRQIS